MKFIGEFIMLFGIWLLLTWSLAPAQVIAGVVVTLLVTGLAGDIFVFKASRAFNPVRIFWMIVYIPYFLWYVVLANLDVAYRVIHPDLPIRPGIVKIQTSLNTDMAKTFLANSITLTPGTLTVDIKENELYIHWIYVHGKDVKEWSEAIAGRFEPILRRIFE
ncbi:Na+/H+ antiporter subunit E [bacterium]|nr:MAG: Na+/H+ antiporter subunit E [bacterium]